MDVNVCKLYSGTGGRKGSSSGRLTHGDSVYVVSADDGPQQRATVRLYVFRLAKVHVTKETAIVACTYCRSEDFDGRNVGFIY